MDRGHLFIRDGTAFCLEGMDGLLSSGLLVVPSDSVSHFFLLVM